jgi:replication factor A2
MQVLPSHAVKANTSIHEMQGQLPHAVKTNAPAYVPFSSGVRDQVHSAQVNQGQLPMSVQTNASSHVPFYGGVREQHDYFTSQPNQV